jgi:hypothetical protein
MAPISLPQEMADTEIKIMAEIFERDGDRSAAWRAFFLSRKFELELPESINAEINRFAEAVGSIADRAHRGDATATIDNETVGKIWKNHENRDAGPAAFRARRSFDIAVRVEQLRRYGYSSADAVLGVCKLLGVSKTTVHNAMKQHSDIRHDGSDVLDTIWWPTNADRRKIEETNFQRSGGTSNEVGSLK